MHAEYYQPTVSLAFKMIFNAQFSFKFEQFNA